MPTRVIWPTYTIGAWAANVDDDFGCRWIVEKQTLNDGLARKLHTSERPFGVGAYRSRSYPAARTGVIQGYCQAQDRAGRVAARDRLMSLFPDGGQALLVVNDGVAPRQLVVELDSDVLKCEVWQTGEGIDWLLPLYAADPRWMDTTVRTAGPVTIGSVSSDGLNWGPPDPMFVAAGTVSEGSNANRTPGMPAGVQAGDLLLVFTAIRNSGAGVPDTPAGYTLLVDGSNMRLFGKIYDGVEAAPTLTYTGGVAGATNHAQMAAFRGVSLSVLNSANQLNASAQDVAYPALTVAQGLATVLYLAWKQNTWTGAAVVPSATEIGDISTVTGNGAAIAWDYLLQTVNPSNVGAGSFTITGGAAAISRGGVVALGATGGGLDWAAGSPGGLDWGSSGAGNLLVLANPGSAVTWPVFTITTATALTNPVLTNPATGDVLAYSGTIESGQTLTIDCSPFTRSVTLNGIDRSSSLSSAQWIDIPAGQTTTVQVSGTGAGTVTAAWQYAYN